MKRLLAPTNPALGRCPDCKKTGTLRRSKTRSTKESILKNFTFYKIYRCRECGWRGYLATLNFGMDSLKTLGFYILIAILAAFIIRFILIRIA